MGIVAERLSRVHESATKAMTARAAALRAHGRDVITLSQGELDADTPLHVQRAAHDAIAAGHTRYTPVAGVPALREAIARKLARDNGLELSPEQVTVGCGAKQVIFNALFASLDPGDEVIVPAPCWVSYVEMIRLAGGTPVVVPTRADAGFRMTPEALDAAITPRTRWLLLNSPCNPTGAIYPAAELRALGAVLARAPRVWTLSDDIYEKLVLSDAAAFATMASAVPALAERTLTVNGVSKSHAMTGWRVGYGAGPLALIRAMNLVQSQTSSHTCSVSQHAAIAALDGDESFLVPLRASLRERRDFLVDAIGRCAGLDCRSPEGAFYLFAGCAPLIGARAPSGASIRDDAALALYLLEEAGVAVVPGEAFLASPYIRLSFATGMAALREAAARIEAACARLTPARRA